jgi:uncharacterized protein (TIGR02186 family)
LRKTVAVSAAALLLGLFLQALLVPSGALAESLNLSVKPNSVDIREYFQGANLTISADIPKGATAVVELKGATHDDHLLRKGRRGGLWMSVGEVTVHGAPSVYLVMSGSDGASHSDGAKEAYGKLEKNVEFGGALPKDGPGALFGQLVKLKESEGLYGVFPDTLKVVGHSGDRATLEGQMKLPSNITPGNYQISLSVFNSGKLLESQTVDMPIEMKGLPALLSTMAHKNAVLYGVFAVVIAIVTGLVMGIVFKGKSAH